MSWVMPLPGKVSSHYGEMSDYRRRNKMQPHSGTDWPAKAGTLINAIADGEVVLIQYSKVLGWVVVQTATDNKGKKWYLGYCHLDCSYHGPECKGGHPSPLKKTKVGDKVSAGQPFLKVGNSGSATTGAHLHATASKLKKGVFGITGIKSDLFKLIQANAKGPAPKQANPKAPPVVQVKVCESCKRPL